MNKIKFLKANTVTGVQKIKLNGVTYKPHTICDLPNQFGMSEEITDEDVLMQSYARDEHLLELQRREEWYDKSNMYGF